MPEPIKVTREQWDEAYERYCSETDARDSFERASARAEFKRVLGTRPAPDTPPDLTTDGGDVIARTLTAEDGATVVSIPAMLYPSEFVAMRDWLTAVIEATEVASDA